MFRKTRIWIPNTSKILKDELKPNIASRAQQLQIFPELFVAANAIVPLVVSWCCSVFWVRAGRSENKVHSKWIDHGRTSFFNNCSFDKQFLCSVGFLYFFKSMELAHFMLAYFNRMRQWNRCLLRWFSGQFPGEDHKLKLTEIFVHWRKFPSAESFVLRHL